MSLDFQEENEPDQPEERLLRVTPVVPYFSYFLIGCLLAVFGAQVALDSTESLLVGGIQSAIVAGFDKPAFLSGEYWRALTGAALHGGLIHLFFNCYALYALGRLIELLSNRAHLANVFLLSVIGGSMMSLAVNPDGVSVGASGGIIGFLGYLTVYGFYRRKVLSNSLLKNMLFNVAFIGFVGVYVIDKVDNFAHLGGLLVGAVYGVFQIPRDVYQDPREVSEPNALIGFASLGIFGFVSVFTILLLFGIIRF